MGSRRIGTEITKETIYCRIISFVGSYLNELAELVAYTIFCAESSIVIHNDFSVAPTIQLVDILLANFLFTGRYPNRFDKLSFVFVKKLLVVLK